MKAIGILLQLTAQYLKDKEIPRARRVAEELLCHVLELPRLELYLQFDRPLEEEEVNAYRALVRRAAQGEPLEYILGALTFYGASLQITPHVLIPRPETEILLDKICERLRRESSLHKQVWDIGTGSGCLGIGIKKSLPALRVVLSDISAAALDVARANAKRNGVDVECVEGDLLTPFVGRKADIIICNPPYISKNEYKSLDRSVRDYEPECALVGGEDGLAIYARLAESLPQFLQPQALLFFEIGKDQAVAVQKLFSHPHWHSSRLEKDWSGHDRFFFIEFQ